MRIRPLAVIAAVFGAAIAATAFVVARLPREGGPGLAGRAPPMVAVTSPALEPAATPSDGAIDVRVTSGGEPVGGAEVRLWIEAPSRETGGAPLWLRAGEGRTGPSAVARIPARPGAYLASARAPGLVGRAEVVRAAGEDPSRAEVVIEPPVRVLGRIAGAGGAPVAHALVRMTPVASPWPSFASASAPAEEISLGESGDDGAFLVDGLAPGAYALSVEARGYHPVLLSRVEVPAEPVAVALEPLGTAQGIVLFPDGRPASGAEVRAASAEHGATAKAGGDGRFVLAAPAGSYRVGAELGDRAGEARGPVTLGPGAAASPVEIRLGPAASVEGEAVLSASRRPAAGAEVALFPHGTRQIARRATAGGDGRFALRGLAPGAYDLRALAAGASPLLLPGISLAAGSRFPLRLALPGTGAVEGVVRDPAGRPLAGIAVRVVARGDGLAGAAPLSTRTGFDGAFRFDAVETGRAEVVARADGVLAGASRVVRVAEGRASEADVLLAEAGTLSGRVSREGGARPLLGTAVVAVPMRAGLGTLQVARAAADASGNYRLALPAGEYRVHAQASDAAPADLRVAPSFVRIEAGRTARLDLALSTAAPAGGASVLVLEPGGAPSPGAVVTLSRAGEGRIALATSAGDDGRVLLPGDMGMAGRAVTIRARNGGRTGEATLELPRSGSVAVTLSPGGSVDGVVRARGRAPAGFTLEVSAQPAAGGWRTVDVHRFAGERFEIADLPAEPLRLTVRTDDGRRGEAEVRVAGGETRAVTIALDR